nr:Chain B, Mixed-lineage leukemia protein 1 [synthetic construct]
ARAEVHLRKSAFD